MVARNTSSYLPLAGSSSSTSSPASSRICGPSSSALSSLARKLKKILLLLVAFVVLLQLVVLLPYFAGEERMKGWGLEAMPHPAPPQWMQPGHWGGGPPPPGPPDHGPPGHGAPPGHGPPGRPDMHPPGPGKDGSLPPTITGEEGYKIGAAHLNGSLAFPPPYHKSFQPFDYAHKSDANPHLGQIPALHLGVLNAVPVLVAPPFPPKAPEINSSVYNLRPWDKVLKGSNTTWEDSFKAHLQLTGQDPRTEPFSGWEPPLALLDTSKPPADKLGKVQYAFTDPTRRSGKQGDEAREKLLAERQRLVRNAFLHAWSGYKRLAWGHDELRPVSEKAQDNFNGWGATIVDALDTLLVMDLPGEYNLARSHVRDIDFSLVGGERSAYGSSDGRLPVFETAIRYLGGMLAAYDLSGDELMKDRAEELAQRLEAAFDTKSGVPVGRIRLAEDINQPVNYGRGGFGSGHAFSSVVLSEAGSMLLEYTRLWQATGNRAYFDRVQRVTDWFDKNMTEAAGTGGMLYNIIFPEQHTGSGSISFGGMSDSYYEYLIKEHQLLGGRIPQYGRMYSAAIDTASDFIIRDIKSVPNASLVVPGVFEHKAWNAKLEHLACFTGAMVGLGAKLMPKERGKDYDVAQRISETCWWTYNSTNTGIGPEYTIFYEEYDAHRGQNGHKVGKYGKTAQAAGWPIEGIRGQLPDYRGRPETIESVFYMWRITGDPVWQERGWQMFSSWVTHSMTNVGFANIQDVNKVPAPLMDSMESFVFAETFKYYYLLFSPPDLISLDDYVLTTEAHPLLVPKDGKWVQPGKGPRSFWSGPTSPTNNAITSTSGSSKSGAIYTGGEASNTAPGHLTNAQKHSVYKAWQERMAEKDRKEAAMQARIALNRAVQMAKERGEDAVSALVARMKGWVGGTEEEEAEAAAATEGLQKRSSTSLEEEGSQSHEPTSAAAVDATSCAEPSEAPADEALMSRVKLELQALINSAIGAMDEETPSASGSLQDSSSSSSATQGQYFTSDSNSNAQPPATAEQDTPSSTTSLALPEGYVSILVETDVEIPVEVRFHPQAFAHMEMTDEDLARWLARENQAPQRVVSSWELLEGSKGKGRGQTVFSAAGAEDQEEQQQQQAEAGEAQASPAALQYMDEPDEPDEPEAQGEGEEELLSLEHVSAMGVDVLRAALRSMERHFALTFAPSSSAASASASEASSSAGSAATEQDSSDSDSASDSSNTSLSSSPSSSAAPPPPPPAAPTADREQGADSHRGGAPRQAMGFGGRMMYRAQAGQRLREEREEEVRRRERGEILERAEGGGIGGGGGSEELLRRARERERAGDGEGDVRQ